MTAEREQMVRKIGDLPECSEGMFRGHHVERLVAGFWVDRVGPMRLEEAVDKVLAVVADDGVSEYMPRAIAALRKFRDENGCGCERPKS